jgi:hypothetical protein
MLSHRRITPKELKAYGWTPDAQPLWHFGRCYTHRDGWRIQHCGHPTALWPYLLLSPEGQIILTGAAACGRPDYGTAWPTVAAAVDYVRGRGKQ